MPLIPPNPINANTYLPPATVIPGDLLITAISQSYPMEVTFIDSDVNTYIAGQNVRLAIPSIYGMQQANGLTGTILSVDNTNFIFTLDIDSTNFDPFWYPGMYVGTPQTKLKFNNGFISLLSQLTFPSFVSLLPGSITLGLKGNIYTDPGADGILIGSPNGNGTVDYQTGNIQVDLFLPGVSNGSINAFSYVVTFQTYQIQPAAMCPAGSKNLQYSNQSARVAFQNLNNRGN